MSEQKPNDPFGWKNKLDELDHLPGEQVPDKNASWEKLHRRLQKDPHKKHTLWYWAAAASLLLLSGTQWLRINETARHHVKNSSQHTKGIPPAVHTPATDDTPLVALQAQTEKQQTVVRKIPIKKDAHAVYATVPPGKPAVTDTSFTINAVQQVYDSSVKPDTGAFTAIIPPKKKLRVVHINELGKRVDEQMPLAQTNGVPELHAGRSGHDRSFTVSRNTSDDIVQIKLSPSN